MMTAKSAIGYCVELTGADLALLREYVNHPEARQVEIATDKNGLRVKVNWGVWGPPVGRVTGIPS
jgi:hypothetical protein